MTDEIEISIVLPCLNEADTLAMCIKEINQQIVSHSLKAELIVADNGSSDLSQQIAQQLSTVLLVIKERGYGAALLGGIKIARGKYVLIGDADYSYDFSQIVFFLERLRAGAQLVVGCRLPAGGGRILPGAMPILHRWFGNPCFSLLAKLWFGVKIDDVNCGMRAFDRSAISALSLNCKGMEFAIEMIAKASAKGLRIEQVPIILRPDARKSHPPHLKTWRDGWRSLMVFLNHR